MAATLLLMDALRRITDLNARLRPGGAGNTGDLIEAEATARQAIAIAQTALKEGAEGGALLDSKPEEVPVRVSFVCDCGHEWSEVHWTEDSSRCPRCDIPCAPMHVELLDSTDPD